MTDELSDEEKYGVCTHGHPWTEANTLYESSGRKGGSKRRRCRQCRKDRRLLAAAEAQRSSLEGYGGKSRRGRAVTKLVSSGNLKATDEFAEAKNHVRPHCAGRNAEFADWNSSHAPSAAEAEALCAPCPLQELCLAAAIENDEPWGVWGGKVFMKWEDDD